MASCRSIKRCGCGRGRGRMVSKFGFGSGKVLLQNSAAKPRKSVRVSRFWGKKLPGVHHVVSLCSRKRGHRLYANSCSYDDENWSSEINMWSPFPTSTPYLVGSCNGLLCFQYGSRHLGSGSAIVVWEPSTKKLQVIPDPPSVVRPCFCKSKKCDRTILPDGGGLHFDSRSGDYKFFRFTTNFYDKINKRGYNENGFHADTNHVEVYSLKNNAWKELTYPLFKFQGKKTQYPVLGDGEGICVNGVCYWHGSCVGDDTFILSYSFLTEEFSSFRCPVFENDDNFMLVEMDGLLCLLIYPRVIDSKDPRAKICLKSYTSLPSQPWLDVKGFEVPIVGLHEPLWFGKRNDSYYLLLKGPEGDLKEYDYTQKVFNRIHKSHRPGFTYDREFVYETKTKNNANIWHSSSFDAVKLQK